MRPAGLPVEDGRTLGFHGNDLHGRVLLLESATNAGDGASSAHACHEDVHLPVRLLPDFPARGDIVLGGVGGVFELLEDDAAGRGIAQGFGCCDGALHAIFTRGQTHLGAISLDEVATFHAHGLGHGQDEVVALDGADESQAYARVAAGGFDDGGAGFEQAALFGILNHGEGDAVLDTATRVEELHLGDNGGGESFLSREFIELQKRSTTDEVGQLFCYM